MLSVGFLSLRINMYSISNYATCLKEELNELLLNDTTVLFQIMMKN